MRSFLLGAFSCLTLALVQGAPGQAPEKDHEAEGIPKIMWWQCAGELSVRDLQMKAEGGDARASAQLAFRMIYTREFDYDADKVFQLFSASTVKGNPLGEAGLSYCYTYGIGCALDENLALKHATESADAGNHHGLYLLSLCHQYGLGVKADDVRALALAKEAAEMGSPWGKRRVAYHGIHDPELEESSLAIIEELAEQDFPPALLDLGLRRIREGEREQGMIDMARSARFGFASAMSEYGKALVRKGEINEGIEWMLESVDRGCFSGAGELGVMLFESRIKKPGAAQNIVAGSSGATFDFLDMAYRRGSKSHKVYGYLATQYVYARGTKKNDEMAVRLIGEAWDRFDETNSRHTCELAFRSSDVFFRAEPPFQDIGKAIAYELYQQHEGSGNVTRIAYFHSLEKNKETYDPVRAWAAVLTAREKKYESSFLDLALKNIEGRLNPAQLKEAEALSAKGFPVALEFRQEGAKTLGRPTPE